MTATFVAAVITLAAHTPAARAQVERRAADAHIFRPAMDGHGIFVVDRADVGKPWSWGFRFGMHVAATPINLGMSGIDNGDVTSPVDTSLTVHLGFHVTFTKWMALAIDVPFSRQWLGLAYDQDEAGGFIANDPLSNMRRMPQEVTAGDPRLALKFRLFGVKGFSMALAAMVTFPFGDEATFNGDASFTVEPRIILSYDVGPVAIAANVGYLWREKNRVYDPAVAGDSVLFELDDEITWGVGAAFRLSSFMSLGIELYGRGPILADMDDLPMEALAGLMFNWGRISWAVGGGVGIGSFLEHHGLKPYGRSATWRFFTMLTFTPTLKKGARTLKDTDGDGINDDVDQCPTEPEDKDGFEDEDGCPDPDNDQDGIPDVKDKCPDKAEDRDGFQDDDGCPDLDNDGDGIPDKQDKCPNEPEDRNGVDDNDGCPEGGVGSISGGKIDLKGKRIQFKAGSATLIKESLKILDVIANRLRNNPNVKLVRIEGHTDDQGNDAANLRLSQRRAASVRDYLIKRGVAQNRLTAVGYGETRPKVPNTSKKNRAINRRVEFIIVHQTQ